MKSILIGILLVIVTLFSGCGDCGGATTSSKRHISFLDPWTIHFTQDSISPVFKDGRTLQELIDGLASGKIKGNEVPPIRIFEKNYKVFTLDNRRLEAFRRANTKIGTVPATAAEVARESWKFTTKNEGTSIRIRYAEEK